MPPLTLPGINPPVSRLALGTMLHGSSISTDDAFALLDDFRTGGGTVLDTASACNFRRSTYTGSTATTRICRWPS